MRKNSIVAFVTLALAVALAVALALPDASAVQVTATAKVVEQVQCTKDRDLSFGVIAPSLTNDCVVHIEPVDGGNRHFEDPACDGALLPGPPDANSAKFTATGFDNASFVILLPTGDVTLTGAGTGATLTAFMFEHSAGATPTLVGGTLEFFVGAKLTVPANQVADDYNGTFEVTCKYN